MLAGRVRRVPHEALRRRELAGRDADLDHHGKPAEDLERRLRERLDLLDVGHGLGELPANGETRAAWISAGPSACGSPTSRARGRTSATSPSRLVEPAPCARTGARR